jgi:hypothetical protein
LNKLLIVLVVSSLGLSCASESPNNDSSNNPDEESIAVEEPKPIVEPTPTVELDSNGLVKDSVRIAAEAYLLERLNNPASYQFASLATTNDVFTQRRNLEHRIDWFGNSNNLSQPDPEVARQVKSLLDSLGDSADAVACYVYKYNFRATNAMGGLVLTNSLLYITPDYGVVHIALTDGQRYETTCNELPEYREIILSRRR